MEPRHLVILAYHKIGPPAPGGWETWYYVPEETFAAQLDCLQQLGWSVIDVAAFLAGLDDPGSLPPRAALVTFDDGYRNIHDCALPRLRERGCPGVVFVPTQYIGGINGFDADTREPPEPICSWEHLRELESMRTQTEEMLRLGRLTVSVWSRSHRNVAAGIPVPPAIDLVQLLQRAAKVGNDVF